MPGFKSITVEDGDEAGTQKVTVVTDGSKEITQEAAIESLGDKAKKYVVVTWAVDGKES